MERHSYGDARSKLRSPTARDSPRKNEVPRANEHSVQSLEIGGQKWQKSIKWDRIRRIWIIFDVNPIEEVSGHSSRRVDKFNGHLHLLSSSLSLLLFFLLIFLFSLPLPCPAFHLSILWEV
jgi:hypothetical protein